MRLLLIAGSCLLALVSMPFLMPTTSAQEGGQTAEYVGSDTCKKCHFKEHRYWKKTGLAESMKTLKPTAEAEAEMFAKKKAAGLDPAKDYTTDASCLGCHTTGYGKKGGYPADAAKEADLAAKMGEVGCEACHGPGSLYAAHKAAELEKNKEAKFDFEGLAKFGLVKPNADNCATCHNDKNPAKPAEAFEFEKQKGNVHSKK